MTQNKQGWFKASEPAAPCPAMDELWGFSLGELAAERRDSVREHLTGCVWCTEKVARFAESGVQNASAAEPVPDALNRKTRRLWAQNPLSRIWRSSLFWMTLFVGSLAASFTQPRYYKQFLVIALVAGIRWALSERARHSILISRIQPPASSDSKRHSRVDERAG